MYTPESNNKDNILHNLPLILDYLYEEKHKFKTYDLFSGEFFNLPFWEDVLEIIYNDSCRYEKGSKHVAIPTNMSWLMDDEKANKVYDWIEKFEKNSVGFHISCSVDGPENLENISRPLTSEHHKEKDFYEKFFAFLKKYNYCAHPMITRNFVKNYKENYDFWIDNLYKYDISINTAKGKKYLIPMFLEVRDPDQWDEESLKNYRDFLFYAAEKDLTTYHENSVKELAYHIADDFSDGMKNLGKYCNQQPYFLAMPNKQPKIPCSI